MTIRMGRRILQLMRTDRQQSGSVGTTKRTWRMASRPVWIVCRSRLTIPLADDAALLRCAECGRIEPDDYVVNQRTDTCVRARDMTEIREIFRRRTIRRLEKISVVLAWIWRGLTSGSGRA